MPVRSDSPPSPDVVERSASAWKGETAAVGGGVLLAVGPVVAFFSWWSWWTAAGLILGVAGALWLAFGEAGADVGGAAR
ncbi:hypothetical protein [Amycolatopsis pittospori]|uniref:hypothetical protein n=1 Tax=Amycolatopsis pittospori TaxID=2749434 RepID=UPI0015F0E4E1|nr:hypothetical protein [Amycolatopsis pittospori]